MIHVLKYRPAPAQYRVPANLADAQPGPTPNHRQRSQPGASLRCDRPRNLRRQPDAPTPAQHPKTAEFAQVSHRLYRISPLICEYMSSAVRITFELLS